MSSLAPDHLPGFDAARAPRRLLAGTAMRTPILDPQAVLGVWDTLDAAAAAWRELDLEARIEVVARCAAHLRQRGPGAWREMLSISGGLSPAGLDAAWETTFAPYDAAALHAALRLEGLMDEGAAAWRNAPRRIAHVLAGNVLPPTFAMLARGWILGAAQWLRPAAREPLFAASIAAALPEVAPVLADTLAVLWWPHEDARTAAAVLAAADVVTVQGDDATVAGLQREVARLSPATRFVGYGSRWSLALVSAAAQTRQTAQGVAWDVALFDQQGCLSPRLVLAECGADLERWCTEVAAALRELELRMPRGPLTPEARASLRSWRETMRLGGALGEVRSLWESDGTTAWAVTRLATCRDAPCPLDRHVVVAPFASLDEIAAALSDSLGTLQGVAAALEGWSEARQQAVMRLLRPTRIAPPGDLQAAPPSWPQDHRPPFGSLLVDGESGALRARERAARPPRAARDRDGSPRS